MNYTPAENLPSEHSLKRLQKWMMLTLIWFAAHVLAVMAPATAARWLREMRHNLRAVMLVRAFHRAPDPPLASHPGCYDRAWVTDTIRLRGMAGYKFMRALSGRGALEQSRALYAVLADAERWIDHLVRRLRRGFTRLVRPRGVAHAAPQLAAAHVSLCAADSS